MGVCRGANLAPYEESCSAIVAELPWIDNHIASLRNRVAEIQLKTGSTGWHRAYGKQSPSDRASKYFWVEVEFIQSPAGRIGIQYPDGREDFRLCLDYSLTPEEHARKGDAKYIDAELLPAIAHYAAYREWCVQRISNWKPRPLTAIAELAAA